MQVTRSGFLFTESLSSKNYHLLVLHFCITIFQISIIGMFASSASLVLACRVCTSMKHLKYPWENSAVSGTTYGLTTGLGLQRAKHVPCSLFRFCFIFRAGGSGGGGVIFLETGGKPGSSAAKHTFIEAVPVPRNASLDAPMFFRQVRDCRLDCMTVGFDYRWCWRDAGVAVDRNHLIECCCRFYCGCA